METTAKRVRLERMRKRGGRWRVWLGDQVAGVAELSKRQMLYPGPVWLALPGMKGDGDCLAVCANRESAVCVLVAKLLGKEPAPLAELLGS